MLNSQTYDSWPQRYGWPGWVEVTERGSGRNLIVKWFARMIMISDGEDLFVGSALPRRPTYPDFSGSVQSYLIPILLLFFFLRFWVTVALLMAQQNALILWLLASVSLDSCFLYVCLDNSLWISWEQKWSLQCCLQDYLCNVYCPFGMWHVEDCVVARLLSTVTSVGGVASFMYPLCSSDDTVYVERADSMRLRMKLPFP